MTGRTTVPSFVLVLPLALSGVSWELSVVVGASAVSPDGQEESTGTGKCLMGIPWLMPGFDGSRSSWTKGVLLFLIVLSTFFLLFFDLSHLFSVCGRSCMPEVCVGKEYMFFFSLAPASFTWCSVTLQTSPSNSVTQPLKREFPKQTNLLIM